MKRAFTLILCFVTVAIGLWILSASHTLDSACTLSAQSGQGPSCVSGVPFQVLGIALTTMGVVSMSIVLIGSIRAARRRLIGQEPSSISTLHQHDVDSLRDVA
jgi:hypothetical protein